MKPSQSVKPVSYLKAHASDLVREIGENGRTYIITQDGEAKAVVQGVAAYEANQDSLALLKMLSQSSKSLREGRFKSAEKAFEDIDAQIRKES